MCLLSRKVYFLQKPIYYTFLKRVHEVGSIKKSFLFYFLLSDINKGSIEKGKITWILFKKYQSQQPRPGSNSESLLARFTQGLEEFHFQNWRKYLYDFHLEKKIEWNPFPFSPILLVFCKGVGNGLRQRHDGGSLHQNIWRINRKPSGFRLSGIPFHNRMLSLESGNGNARKQSQGAL